MTPELPLFPNWTSIRSQSRTSPFRRPGLPWRKFAVVFGLLMALGMSRTAAAWMSRMSQNYHGFSLPVAGPIDSQANQQDAPVVSSSQATNQPQAAPAALVSVSFLPSDNHESPRPLSNGYAWGNCTWYVASRRQVPAHWGNARNWYYAARAAGWPVGDKPAVGAIAWTPAGFFGHVALVEQVRGNQVLISEMNYTRVGLYHQRWVNASEFRYIY